MIPVSKTTEQARRTVRRLLDAGENLPGSLRRAVVAMKDAAVPPLLEILMEEEDGYAPAHAAALLGELRATVAIQPMLDLLVETEWDEIVHDAIIQALPRIGAPVVEPALLAYVECDDFDFRFSLGEVLAGCGARDDRILARLLELFEIEPDGAAMHLASYGDPRAIEHLSLAFDAYQLIPTEGPLGNQDLIELRSAIEQLGGALTPSQENKYQQAMEPLERWRRARAAKMPPERAARPGRNEPCWCGSATKYKRCHLDADQAEVVGQGAFS